MLFGFTSYLYIRFIKSSLFFRLTARLSNSLDSYAMRFSNTMRSYVISSSHRNRRSPFFFFLNPSRRGKCRARKPSLTIYLLRFSTVGKKKQFASLPRTLFSRYDLMVASNPRNRCADHGKRCLLIVYRSQDYYFLPPAEPGSVTG